jgi:hypothetical protein
MAPRVLRTLVCAFAFLFGLAAAPAFAQDTVNFATLSGTVTDVSGGVVIGAEVRATHVATNVATSATTDAAGRFRLPYLRVGDYEITVSAPGLRQEVRRLTATAGASFDVPVTLSPAGVSNEVTVTAETAIVDAARSQIASTVSADEARVLPMNGRNFLDLALLVPGVSPTNVGGGTQLFPETSAVPGVGLSVGSQRNLSNNFMVDGLSANDDAAALSGIAYGVNAIDQFQVITSGGQAEMGRALGGYVNVVTRSGTNLFTGETYGFFRDDRFNAPNPLLQASGAAGNGKLPMHQNQWGASIGGPIARDRTFFYGNVEQRLLDQSGLVTIPQATVDTINAHLASAGYQGPGVSTGIYANPVDALTALAKVDHHVTTGDLLTVRYSAYTVDSDHSRGAGGTAAPSASAGLDNVDQTIAGSYVRVLSDKTIWETRGQFAHSNLKALPADPIGPAVSISGVASFGTSSGSPTGRVTDMSEIVSNLSYQQGRHALKAGVDVLANDVTITYPRSVRGAYAFSNLANFLAGVYTNTGFTQTFGDSTIAQTNPNLGIYAQDEWRIRPSLTLNLGLRYDLQWLETIATDTNNVSPRLGAAWALDAAHRSVLRANAGRFYDRVPLRALANALLSAGNTTDLSNLRQIGVSLAPTQTGAPAFPNILTEIVPTTTLVNLSTMDRQLQNAYSDQASVELERQLGSRSSMTIGYQYLRGRNLLMSINQNVPTCAASGSNNGCRPNPSYANNSQYSAAGASNYKGLELAFVQRPSSWGSVRVSYTYSKSMNNVGEAFFSSPIDPTDVSKDWGRSDDDQRHRLTVLASVHTPMTRAATPAQVLTHGFQLSVMTQYYSALPFNITTGTNTIQGTAARPMVDGAFIPRNAGEGSPFSTTSVRLSRSVRLGPRARIEGLVEAFNVFNRRNDIARVTVFGTGAYPDHPAPNFGQVTVVGDPRSIQFGFRIRY